MRTPLLVLLLSLVSPAWALPEDALPPVPRRIYNEGAALEARGAFGDAAVRYRSVIELEPGWLQAVYDLGRVLEAADRPADAEAAYQRAPFYGDAVEALGKLYLRQGRYAESATRFEKLRDLRTGTPESLLWEARAKAHLDAASAVEVLEEYLDREGSRLDTLEAVQAVADVCESAWVAERAGEDDMLGRAGALLSRARLQMEREGLGPEAPEREPLAAFEEEMAIQMEAQRLATAADTALTEEQAGRLASALRLHSAGASEPALDALVSLTTEAPRSALAWGARADVHRAAREITEAEYAARVAEQLDPLDPAHSARLGDILLDDFGGRFDGEAAAAYARALVRPGANPELWFRRGRAERGAGLHAASVASFGRYLEQVPGGSRVADAQRMVSGFDMDRAQDPPAKIPEVLPSGMDAMLWERYWTAVVLAQPPRGAPDQLARALAELEPVVAAAPNWTEAKNLQAAIALRQGKIDAAIDGYRNSLELDGSQGEVLLVLADLLRQQGRADEALALEEQAAVGGEPLAHLRLGLRDEAAWRYPAARRHLEAYLSWTRRDRTEARDREAVAAMARIQQRRQLAGGLAIGGLALVIGLPVATRWRRRTGASLGALIESSPSAWPDVARILSAVRHEVLKHHTTVLPAVAEEIDTGDPALGAWAADRLAGPRGAIARFRAYVAELETLGQAHGVRVNLRHRDPVFAPMIAAVDELEALEDGLRAGDTAVVEPLRDIAARLNTTAYSDLGALLRRLCILPLEGGVFRDLWDGVRTELQSDLPLDVEVPDDDVLLRIFRRELDDILTNLLRNALEAASDGQAPRVGVCVASDEDPITGLERVEIRVRDNATRRISTAMIRGRYIGRGLGLAVDLISRNGGSIHVEDEPGWSKAVVVRLPRAEAPDLEDA